MEKRGEPVEVMMDWTELPENEKSLEEEYMTEERKKFMAKFQRLR